ncbi:uroporphyrinogen III methyltransferase / synthase [Desulfacinum infernum DSM 9756]|uniref:uroporphyrinogen-III C-methyltransferase n=1 Tax=Desulfacinum infernum DSM 9756 TaxID=1121391 RepID=A0A1M4X4H4_9BACT|nr:uroporphyrinogen III methyltransferase / synthase [Desulfacinum infernum DSM 9756]
MLPADREDDVKKGKVYLVGAGPGDPGLFTLRGLEVLRRAEVVIYDFLANEELLSFAPPHADRIYVGKKGGDHTLSQDGINRLLVEKGRHHVVVRLKGGDPFVFGRGGEEAQELVAAGIDFEVVPGVTAAVAVPAYAGIPLSHRDFTASMAFITGHERADSRESKIDWSKLATAVGTLVFFMGVKNLPDITARLMEHGRSPETPVAVIRWGTTPEQRTVTGTLGDVVDRVREAGLKPPALIVVGEVVRLRDQLNWFERRPLFGRTVLVTRARQQASDFKRLLEEKGARCVEFPTIRIAPPESWEPLDRALSELQTYDWVIFTSVNGVRFFMERLFEAGKDVRALAGVKLAAIGPKTAEALEARGLRLDVVPGEYRAEGILQAMGADSVQGARILLPRAKVARDVLPETLRKWGALVDVVPAYETVLPTEGADRVAEMLREGRVDVVTFTSSSTVTNFLHVFEAHDPLKLLEKTTVACIGPITADTARGRGVPVHVVAEEYTIPGLVQALCDYLAC